MHHLMILLLKRFMIFVSAIGLQLYCLAFVVECEETLRDAVTQTHSKASWVTLLKKF